jgi:hypothetical protein
MAGNAVAANDYTKDEAKTLLNMFIDESIESAVGLVNVSNIDDLVKNKMSNSDLETLGNLIVDPDNFTMDNTAAGVANARPKAAAAIAEATTRIPANNQAELVAARAAALREDNQTISEASRQDSKPKVAGTGVFVHSTLRAKLAKALSKFQNLVDYFSYRSSKFAAAAPPAPKQMFNYGGLNLLLLNPGYAAIVDAQRKQQAKNASPARLVSGAPFPFLGRPGGLTISLTGGSQMETLDSNYPIEMRGGGYKFAALGGYFGMVNFRPPTDSSFISQPLETAIQNLKSTLGQKGAKLDNDVEVRVNGLVADLKETEKRIQEHARTLQSYNAGVMSNEIKAESGKTYNIANIEQTVSSYNDAMKRRSKIEGKLFKVVVALGNEVVASSP